MAGRSCSLARQARPDTGGRRRGSGVPTDGTRPTVRVISRCSPARRRLTARVFAVLLDLATSPPAAFLPLRPSPTTRKSATSITASPPHATHELPYASPPAARRRPLFPTPRSLLRNTNAHRSADRKPTTTAMTQVEVLAKREARNLVRDKGLVVRRFARSSG